MKKLFTHLLVVVAAILLGTAPVSAQEPLAIDFDNITPAPFTMFVKGSANQYLHEVDIMFPGAQDIKVSADLTPMIGMVGATAAPNIKTHPTWLGNVPKIEVIEGGVRVTVYGKGQYGSEELGLSYMVATSAPVLKLPQGIITVKGADGVERSNDDTYLRYFWENFEAVHPIGIQPGCKVSAAQLSTITFPDDITIGTQTSNYYGNTLKLLKGVGSEKPVEVASYALSQAEGAPLVGSLVMKEEDATLASGEYFIAYTSNKIFNKNGVEQKGSYIFPVNVIESVSTEMNVKIADGFSATGKNVPEFALSVAGTPVFAPGAVTATIGDKTYSLTVSGDNLAFSADDAAAIKAQYANKDAFQVVIAAAAAAVTVSGEQLYANSNAIAASFTVKIEDMMDFSQYEGTYYMKYLIGESQDGDPVEIRGLNPAMLMDFSDNGDGSVYALTGFADPAPAEPGTMSNMLAYGVSNAANHSVDFPACQIPIFFKSNLMSEPVQAGLIAKGEDAMTYDPGAAVKIPAYISEDRTINFDGWKLASFDDNLKVTYAYVTDGKSLFIPLSETKPQSTSDFKVDFVSGANGVEVAGSAVLPESDVTGFEVYCNNELLYWNYRVSGGEHLDFVLDLDLVKGTEYSFTAKVYNCLTEADPATVVLTYDPIDIDDVLGDYKTEVFKGKMTPYAEGVAKSVNVLVDDTDFSYVGKAMKVAADGEAVGVEYPIVITGIGDFSMKGTFNALTGRFTFKQKGAYTFKFTYIDPDTEKETDGTLSMDMISYNKSGDIVKNTPAVADFAEGKITFGGGVSPAWCLVYYGGMDLWNNDAISCTEMVLVKDVPVETVAPASPALSLSDAPAAGMHHVTGTVTMPEVDAEGKELPADAKMSVYVYRNVPAGPMEPLMNKVVPADDAPQQEGYTLVYAGKDAAPGEVVPFTDPATDLNQEQEYFYIAFAVYNGTSCENPGMALLDSYTAIKDIFTDENATHNVYNMQGMLLIRDANADAVRSLNTGLYIVGGRKIFVK